MRNPTDVAKQPNAFVLCWDCPAAVTSGLNVDVGLAASIWNVHGDSVLQPQRGYVVIVAAGHSMTETLAPRTAEIPLCVSHGCYRKKHASLSLLVSGSANAVIFHPTDQNVNFFTLAVQGDISGLELGVFDDSVVSFAGQPWLSVNVMTGDIVDFSPALGQNTNYSLTNNAYDTTPLGVHNTLTLTGNDNFQLALRRGVPGVSDFIAWAFADSTVCSNNTNSCNVSWNFGTTQLVVDVQTVDVPPVPVPTWLFGSGLLGLAGVARRRTV